MKPAAGAVIDDSFELLRQIGEGGIGTVFEAEQLALKRRVAVKFMREELSDDDSWHKRFVQEGKILASLLHPNIVRCYSIGIWHDRVPYLVFELLQGKTLKQILNESAAIAYPTAIKIALDICSGLEHAHAQGVVHRDLKPENVMVFDFEKGKKCSAKILDFGLSRIWTESSQNLTETGFLLGSLPYMSPEQCQGKHPDQRADIYSLACVLYECLSGEAPFDADNPMGMIYKHVNESAESLHDKKTDCPAILDPVLRKAMAKMPEDRYQSAADFAADLRAVLESKGAVSEQDLRLDEKFTVAKNSRKNEYLKGSLPAIAASLLIFICWVFFFADPGPAWIWNLLFKNAFSMSAAQKLAALEGKADDYEKGGRVKAAILLYEGAAQFLPESASEAKARLFSKEAISSLKAGDKAASAAFCLRAWDQALIKTLKGVRPEIATCRRLAFVIRNNEQVWKLAPGKLESSRRHYMFSNLRVMEDYCIDDYESLKLIYMTRLLQPIYGLAEAQSYAEYLIVALNEFHRRKDFKAMHETMAVVRARRKSLRDFGFIVGILSKLEKDGLFEKELPSVTLMAWLRGSILMKKSEAVVFAVLMVKSFEWELHKGVLSKPMRTVEIPVDRIEDCLESTSYSPLLQASLFVLAAQSAIEDGRHAATLLWLSKAAKMIPEIKGATYIGSRDKEGLGVIQNNLAVGLLPLESASEEPVFSAAWGREYLKGCCEGISWWLPDATPGKEEFRAMIKDLKI
ncbi:MAG: serine/threonine protein kinase [Candidatus Obscuribacterales bacterium]|nr:serine/threonine protein kinase [Candidatus Obscuribacterales bacterium]